jgi:hypothetical protein
MGYTIHQMVRSWVFWKLSRVETSEYAATVFALARIFLYDEAELCSTPAIRQHTSQLNAILQVFSSNVQQNMMELPNGKYASLYGSVARPLDRTGRTCGSGMATP